MRFLVAAAVIAILGWLFVAVAARGGKHCHLNLHFNNKIVCTKPGR
jgi:hypothetical protein